MTTAAVNYKDALVLCGAGLFNETRALMDTIYETGINGDEERVFDRVHDQEASAGAA